MSSDPNDLAALTPGQFLIGEPITAHPSKNTYEENMSNVQRWRLVNNLKNQFWSRWSNEYLNELQQRKKWKTQLANIKIGTMVIIKEDNTPPLCWPLGRIIKTFKGRDGFVRVAEVKTASGSLKRAIHRLAPLFPEEQTTDLAENTSLHTDDQELSPVIADQSPDLTENISLPTKRRRVTSNIYFTTIIAIMLCLPLVLCNSVKITKYANQPGIHFESTGKIYTISSYWNLVIYYDLQPLKTEVFALKKGNKLLRSICVQVHHELCDDLLPQFTQAADELESESKLFALSRTKRGAINIIGNVANSLFGVLDSEYAEQMSKALKEIEGNDQFLLQLLKNQTSIIDSTINVMQTDQEKVKNKFDSVDRAVNELEKIVKSNNRTFNQHSTLLSLMSLVVHLIITTTSIQKTEAMILKVLTDAHHGKVGPLLLSPQQLKDEIKKIRTHLPPAIQFPVQPDDLLMIYKSMSVQGYVTPGHVIFKIGIPLIGIQEFNMYKVYPIPVKSDNALIAIRTTTDIIAITVHGDSYFPITQQQANNCMALKEQVYLCHLQQPIYHKGSVINTCEISFFNNETKLPCLISELVSEQWIQLDGKNQWIYALKHPIKFTAVCGDDTSQFTIEDSGTLELQPECTIKHKEFTLVGHQDISTSVMPSITTHNSWSKIHDQKTAEPILIEKALHPYNTELKELLALQDALKTQQILQLPHEIQKSNYHLFSVGYTSLTLLVIAAIYKMIKKYQKWRRQHIKPTPAPRQQDFTIQI